MEYLQIEEIHERTQEIRSALESLLASKVLVVRGGALQWRFLRDCFERLLSNEHISDFGRVAPVQLAQYKFEIEDKLRRFYLHPGKPLDFVFTVVHSSKHSLHGIDEGYPSLAGYSLLVRDLSIDRITHDEETGENLRLYLERVVTEANDAEFRAYAALPEIRDDEISRWFCAGSPAYNEIRNILERHNKKRWVISNSYNPSTKRITEVKVKKVSLNEARVSAKEYWYLRWWDEREESYVYAYRESNDQMYELKKIDNEWKVYRNLRGQPRTSTPHRWNRRQK